MKNSQTISPAAIGAAANGDLENFLVAATPGGIEAQEKRGQTTFVSSQTLPIEGTQKPEERKQWEKIGFKFDAQPQDDLFIGVQFPAGWKKVASEHSMWSYITDDKGRRRASVFYKAAFYDRGAHVHFDRRFSYGADYSGDEEDRPVVVKDMGTVIHTVGRKPILDQKDSDGERQRKWAEGDRLENSAKAWLQQHYPEWEDPTAYWD